MNLSRFVYKTKYAHQSVYFHTITKKIIPINSSYDDLKNQDFIEDTDQKVIREKLLCLPSYLSICVNTTWECNLRCNHCCVLKTLKKQDQNSISPKKLIDFLSRYFEKIKTCEKLQLYFLGGESFLYPEKVNSLIDETKKFLEDKNIELHLGTTTNLSYKLKLEHIKAFEKIDNISISLDGFAEQHDSQRFFLDKTNKSSPFQITVENIKKLNKLGFANKIFVQAALKDEYLSLENRIAFTKFLLSLGVSLERTKIGSIFPTEQKKKPSEFWKNHITASTNIRNKPCCKYRLLGNLVLNSDETLYDNFYVRKDSKLGDLDTPIDDLLSNHINLILEKMPVLHDETCKKCPVLAYCWGGCVAGRSVLESQPSKFCNREILIPLISHMAKENKLITNEKPHRSLQLLQIESYKK